jgi:hypothetical protein
MSKPVRVSREAREELLEAARRYGEYRAELRADFLAAVDEALADVVRYAHHLGSPPGIDPTLGVKRVFMRRFVLGVLRGAADALPYCRVRTRAPQAVLLARSPLSAATSGATSAARTFRSSPSGRAARVEALLED